MMNELKWAELMARNGFDSNTNTYNKLLSNYQQKHRYYHNVNHINTVLQYLENTRELADDDNAIEIALWFHDAIYKITSSSNELDSANFASDFLKKNAASSELTQQVHLLIMATLHNAVPKENDEKLIVDIDLSVLGGNEEEYRLFEANIRNEYRLIPKVIYRKRRKEILKRFLERDRIYSHEHFYTMLESNARLNISNAILNL